MTAASLETASAARARRTQRVATASWLLPVSGLALVGFSEKGEGVLPLTGDTLLAIAAATALAGLGAGVVAWLGGAMRAPGAGARAARLGLAASAAVLVVIAIGAWSGAASARRMEADLKQETDAAMRDFAGWNGGLAFDRVRVSASEIDPGCALARRLLRPYDAAFRVVLFRVDNRASSRDVAFDASAARLLSAAGPLATAVPRPAIDAHVVDPSAEATVGRPSSVRVPAGDRFDGALALFPPGTSLREASAIEVQIDGAERAVPGRYFTLDDKRAIDAARRGPPPAR